MEQHVSRKLQQKTVGLVAQVIHSGSPALMQLLAINGCCDPMWDVEHMLYD